MGQSMPLPSREWLPYPSSNQDYKRLADYGITFGECDKTGTMIKVTMDKSLNVKTNHDRLDGTATAILYKNGDSIGYIKWRDCAGRPLRANIVVV